MTAPQMISPTRRSLLALAAGAGAAAISSPSFSTPLLASRVDGGAWDAAMLDLIEAKRVLSRTAPAYASARAALEATAPDIAAVDWQGLEGTTPNPGQVRYLDTAKCRSETLRHIDAGFWRHDPDHPRRRLAALDQLDAYRAALAENERRHAPVYRPALMADEVAVERVDRCEERLMEMPAPHGEALLWKIDHLMHDEGDGTIPSWSIDYAEPMLRDARRLLGGNIPQQQSVPTRDRGGRS